MRTAGMLIAAVTLVSCAASDSKDPIDDDFSDISDEKSDAFSDRMKLLGTMQLGQTKDASYTSTPRYVAYKLYGRAGDRVVLDVTSTDGDPVTWLVDSAFTIIAVNDDANGSTFDSHLEATLPANPTDSVDYYVIVREYGLADATFSIALGAKDHELDGWLGRSIYFVVTDRFANGDRSNDNADGYTSNVGDPTVWHGGDFQGLIDRLDYIAGMGFTGIWITPVIQQHDRRSYHGYHGWDWTKIDGHLGSMATLRELVEAAHERGIAVMIDTVANHTGRFDYRSPSFPDAAMYHHNGNITDWNNQGQLENNDLNGLNDLDQDHPVVRQALLDHVRWLVASSGADGLRIDTVKHVPNAFWGEYSRVAGRFTFGEALEGSVDRIAPYTRTLDAVIDYPLYFAMKGVFGHGASGRDLGRVLARDAAYTRPLLGGVFVDNHDQPRFLCDANGATPEAKVAQLRLALAFAFTTRGIPTLYYGTEQGFGSCTDNRQNMFDRADPQAPLYGYIARLNAIRAASAALRTGVQRERWQDGTAYAFEREDGPSAALVVFNLSTGTRTISMRNMHCAPGTVLRDALDSGVTATVDAQLNVSVTVAARSVVILVN